MNGKCPLDTSVFVQSLQNENDLSMNAMDSFDGQKKIFGGAEIQRALKLYEEQLKNLQGKESSEDEIITALSMNNTEETVAEIIVMKNIKSEIEPIMNKSVEEITGILQRFFALAIATIREMPNKPIVNEAQPDDLFKLHIEENPVENGVKSLLNFENYLNVLQQGYNTFIMKLKMECCEKLADDIQSCIHSIQFHSPQNVTLMNTINGNEPSIYVKINTLIQHHFTVIKERITSIIISKIKTFLVYPIEHQLLSLLLDGFLDLTSQQYENIFNFNEESLRNQLEKMKQQHAICEQNYLKFNSMVKEMDSTQHESLEMLLKVKEM